MTRQLGRDLRIVVLNADHVVRLVGQHCAQESPDREEPLLREDEEEQLSLQCPIFDRLLQKGRDGHVACDGEGGDRVQDVLPNANAFGAVRKWSACHVEHSVSHDPVHEHVRKDADDGHAWKHLVETRLQSIADRQVEEVLNERPSIGTVLVGRRCAALRLVLQERVGRARRFGLGASADPHAEQRPHHRPTPVADAHGIGHLRDHCRLCHDDRDQ
mmetsp:Transcript_3401/g.9726  ORF Transcript_3401/g.9726 Transcript_3401/m.9726 type:complete len:216 (+) Transcript_3401:267-914(+)